MEQHNTMKLFIFYTFLVVAILAPVLFLPPVYLMLYVMGVICTFILTYSVENFMWQKVKRALELNDIKVQPDEEA